MLKMRMVDNFNTGSVCILFYTEIPGGKRIFFNFHSGKRLEIDYGKNLTEEEGKKFIMEIPFDLYKPFLKLIAEKANESGLKLDSDLKREGQLEATKYHLEDLRTLLKINDQKT